MAYLIVLLLLLGVLWVISAPLRRARDRGESELSDGESGMRDTRRLDLEAARDAKLREIRDAELDHQTGKLSDEDYDAIDSTLRAEAVALLHELDELAAAGETDD